MLPTKVFKKKQFIYSEGETAREMYIIISGNVKIVKSLKKNPVEIGILEKGSFLGEVAMFRNDKHGATAIAETDLELAVINKEGFDQQLELLPNWFQTLIRNMADRLHDALEQLGGHPKKPPPTAELKKDEHAEPQADKKEENTTPDETSKTEG